MPSFDLQLLLTGDYHDWLLSGLRVSLELAAVALCCAFPLATLVAVLGMAPWPPLRWVSRLYVELIRNIPLVAHLLFWYFGAPELLPEAARQWLYARDIEFLSGVVALTLYTSAYMAEDIRSGLRAVPRVQNEAARALGLDFLQSVRLVVLPQALRVTLSPLVSQVLNLWKDTSLCTVIGVAELMYQAARVETASFRSAEAFAFVTAAYLGVSLLITGLAAGAQHWAPVRAT